MGRDIEKTEATAETTAEATEQTLPGLPGLTEGRVCHYVMTGQEPDVLGHAAGRHRAAIVCRVRDDDPHGARPGARPGLANLIVFPDGPNDLSLARVHEGTPMGLVAGPIWVSGVAHSEEPEPGTWHWPERA